MTTPHGLGYVKMVIMVDEDVDPIQSATGDVGVVVESEKISRGDLVPSPGCNRVTELDRAPSPAGITGSKADHLTPPRRLRQITVVI